MEIESDEALTKSWNTLMFNTPQTANKLVDPHLDETDQVARPPMLQSHRPQSQYPRSQSLEEKVKDASFEIIFPHHAHHSHMARPDHDE